VTSAEKPGTRKDGLSNRQAVLRGRTVKLSDREMLINAANQAMAALQETHFAMISAGLLDQERLNKNFTAHEELRAAIEKAMGKK
jgi:hypothetical protein